MGGINAARTLGEAPDQFLPEALPCLCLPEADLGLLESGFDDSVFLAEVSGLALSALASGLAGVLEVTAGAGFASTLGCTGGSFGSTTST